MGQVASVLLNWRAPTFCSYRSEQEIAKQLSLPSCGSSLKATLKGRNTSLFQNGYVLPVTTPSSRRSNPTPDVGGFQPEGLCKDRYFTKKEEEGEKIKKEDTDQQTLSFTLPSQKHTSWPGLGTPLPLCSLSERRNVPPWLRLLRTKTTSLFHKLLINYAPVFLTSV